MLPLSLRRLEELDRYWRAQRAGKVGHEVPWIFHLPRRRGGRTHVPLDRTEHLLPCGPEERGAAQRRHHALRHSSATHLIESGVEIDRRLAAARAQQPPNYRALSARHRAAAGRGPGGARSH